MDYTTAKKIILMMTIVLIVSLFNGTIVNADAEEQQAPQEISAFTTGEIFVDGVKIIAPTPSMTDGVVMLPLRPIAEELGFDVIWDGEERYVDIGGSYTLWIGQTLFCSDDGVTTREFGPAPEIIDGHTYVPISLFNIGFPDLDATIEEGNVVINHAESKTEFLFGKQAHAFHPETTDAFIPVFAAELKRYNEIAHLLWPDNSVTNQSVVLEDVDNHRCWFIEPDGAIRLLSETETTNLGISRRGNPDDFSFYHGGMYITISEQSLREQTGADKLHVGAYDSILWLTHEGFHKLEQEEKWNKPEHEDIPNPDRKEYLTNISARAKRNLLQRQIMQAVADPDNPALILDALATYEDYKIQNADDFALTFYWDQIEGTASYFEVVSSLFIFYPDQVHSKEDLARAFAFLAKHEDLYIAVGKVSEAYTLGIFVGALLDRLDVDWKESIMREPLRTPIEILRLHFEGATLPEPRQLTEEEIASVTAEIQERIRFLVERQISVLTMLKQTLALMPDEEKRIMEGYLESALQSFEEMIVVLPQEEQNALEDFVKSF